MSCEVCGGPARWLVLELTPPPVTIGRIEDWDPRLDLAQQHQACDAHRMLVQLKYRRRWAESWDDNQGLFPASAEAADRMREAFRQTLNTIKRRIEENDDG